MNTCVVVAILCGVTMVTVHAGESSDGELKYAQQDIVTVGGSQLGGKRVAEFSCGLKYLMDDIQKGDKRALTNHSDTVKRLSRGEYVVLAKAYTDAKQEIYFNLKLESALKICSLTHENVARSVYMHASCDSSLHDRILRHYPHFKKEWQLYYEKTL